MSESHVGGRGAGGRILNCVDCGLPLPLRHPLQDEVAQGWICGNCGSRYRAVIDEERAAELRGHVRSAEPSP